jgi:hypothetical protein
MKILSFGATGMVGQGALRECLVAGDVSRIQTLGRRTTGWQHPELRELVHADLFDCSAIEASLAPFDACLFCIGVTSRGMDEEQYTEIIHGLAMSVAQILVRLHPSMHFIMRFWRRRRQQRDQHHDMETGARTPGKRLAAAAFQGGDRVPAWGSPAPARDPFRNGSLSLVPYAESAAAAVAARAAAEHDIEYRDRWPRDAAGDPPRRGPPRAGSGRYQPARSREVRLIEPLDRADQTQVPADHMDWQAARCGIRDRPGS